MKRTATLVCSAIALLLNTSSAWAWGDQGHETVALIASHYMKPAVLAKVKAILATDTSGLTATDLASEATWADYFRDSDRNTTKVHYNQTHNWHFADIEVPGGSLSTACYGFPGLASGQLASVGPANDCSVDKVTEFAAELKSPTTSAAEKLMALQFILHFVGDLHQPLHSADENDLGGNSKSVTATGFTAGSLHHFWDTPFVEQIAADSTSTANALVANITATQVTQWSSGTPTDWVAEANGIAATTAYGALPKPSSSGVYKLSATYVKNAVSAVKLQLSRAGVRLAYVLNNALQ